MNNKKIIKVKDLIADENALEAKELFQTIEPENSVIYFFVKGSLEQKFQQWGAAINSFQKVLELDPNHVEAKNHIYMIQSVLNYWNPETFNP